MPSCAESMTSLPTMKIMPLEEESTCHQQPSPRDLFSWDSYHGHSFGSYCSYDSDTCSCSDEYDDHDDLSVASYACHKVDTNNNRRVCFCEAVQIREYNVTVGITPTAKDSCPLTLDWSYRPLTASLPRSSDLPCRGVARLSLEKRRQRIAQVQGWSREQVRALEIERVLERLDEVMEHQETLFSLEDLSREGPFAGSAYDQVHSIIDCRERNGDNPLFSLVAVSQELETAVSIWARELETKLPHTV